MLIAKISYVGLNEEEAFKLMETMHNEAGIKAELLPLNSQFKILSEGISVLRSFLKKIEQRFPKARIELENDVEETETEPSPDTVEITEDPDSHEVDKEIGDGITNNLETECEEAEARLEDDLEENVEAIGITTIYEDALVAESENVAEDVAADENSKVVEILQPPESDVPMDTKIGSIELSESSLNKYDAEEELRKVLTPHIEKHNFGENFQKAAICFCDEQKINSRPFKVMLQIVDQLRSIDAIYSNVARRTRMNQALVKVDIRKSFEKWIRSAYPEILEKCPDVSIINFLNIFRKDGEKLF